MSESRYLSRDKLLFTPGPLTTTLNVKAAMLRDYGSRSPEFVQAIKEIRQGLLTVGQVTNQNYTCIIMQGSGTFGVEAIFNSSIANNQKVLILENGAYGKRMAKICDYQKLPYAVLSFSETEKVNIEKVQSYLKSNPGFTHLACIHCETTTGMINPAVEIGKLAK